MSTLNVDKVDPSTGTALEIGSSGDTITIPSGATLVNLGTATGFAGIAWQSVETSTVTAVAGKGYPVNTTSGAITMNLPAGVAGEQVGVVDYAGTFDTNKLTISANGSEKIKGATDDAEMTTERQAGVLTYIDSTQGWVLTSAAPDPGVIEPLTMNYLVVAGGGASGATNATNNPGCGGAGGLRSTVTTTGGGGTLETALTLDLATNYTVTVGGGGSGDGGDGSDSVFSTITSVGGGAAVGTGDANDGGSGGGGGTNSGAGGAGTANQGYAGGTGTNTGGSNYPAGGGGGAGAVGATPANAAADGGAGGVGVAVAITGSSVYYAGGGGGGAKANPGAGGNGGGGAGGDSGDAGGTAGSVNTGGGAGSGGLTGVNTSSAGGSGIVILSYSNIFTITNPGGGLVYSTADVGDDEVASFTSGTGTVQWN